MAGRSTQYKVRRSVGKVPSKSGLNGLKSRRLKLGSVSLDYRHILLTLAAFVFLWQLLYCPNFESPKKPENRQNSPNSSILLDIPNFQYVHHNPSLCSHNLVRDKLLLTIVHSARANLVSRDWIRRTWGQVRRHGDWDVRLLFLLGTQDESDLTSDPDYLNLIQFAVETEAEEYEDILLGTFADVYRNMTYKHLMGYKWIMDFCPGAQYVLRVDDDMFVDIYQVLDFVSKLGRSDSYYCYVMEGRLPERGDETKWSVTRKEFGQDVYPPYCLGAAYLMSIGVVPKIYGISNAVKKTFWIDDVFVTGILRAQYNRRMATPMAWVNMTNIGEVFQLNYNGNAVEGQAWTFTLLDRFYIMGGEMGSLWNKTLLIQNALL